MRVKGIIKIILVLLFDFVLFYSIFESTGAVIGVGIILFSAWIGEYIALIKDNGISLKNSRDYERMKLMYCMEMLTENVKEKSAININKLKIHIIPTDQMNAYAYGFHNIGITRGILNACDELTINAVLSHEISHILCLDAVFNRIIFMNITLLIVSLIVLSFITTSFIWILFFVLCLVGICGGVLSVFFFSGFSKLVKGYFNLIQRIILFFYQAIMGLVSRNCEYRADSYAVTLGYGLELNYFLSRFVGEQGGRQRTLSDILYDTHPATHKRIQRIEQKPIV